eukprot:365927-Prymnesium_polylepis.1
MGWVEHAFKEMVFSYMCFYGGLAQLIVGIIELIKGSTFGFAAFSTYGAYWMAQAIVYIESHKEDTEFEGVAHYTGGKVAHYTTWGLLTFAFWICTWRKNAALVIVFGLLTLTFFLLAIAASKFEGSEDFLKVTGYVGWLTALSAFYTGIAELINEEYGRELLPGLQPLAIPHVMRWRSTPSSSTSSSPTQRGRTE